MRFLAVVLSVGFAPLLAGAQVTSPHDWDRIERLDPGTEVHIRYAAVDLGRTLGHAHQAHEVCSFVAATADEISCTKTRKIFFVPIHANLRVPRSQVASIRQGRTSVSSFLGGLIGVGAGVAASAGLVAASGESNHEDDILLYGLLATLGGSIGSGIGRHTDFAGGPVLYVAP